MNFKRFLCILLLSILPGDLLTAQTYGQDAFVLISEFQAVDAGKVEMQEYESVFASLMQKEITAIYDNQNKPAAVSTDRSGYTSPYFDYWIFNTSLSARIANINSNSGFSDGFHPVSAGLSFTAINTDLYLLLNSDIYYTSRIWTTPSTFLLSADIDLSLFCFFPTGFSTALVREPDDLSFYYGFNIGLLRTPLFPLGYLTGVENLGIGLELLRFTFLWEPDTGDYIIKSNLATISIGYAFSDPEMMWWFFN